MAGWAGGKWLAGKNSPVPEDLTLKRKGRGRDCHSALCRLAGWAKPVCSGKARNDVMGRFGLQQQETTECLHWLAEPSGLFFLHFLSLSVSSDSNTMKRDSPLRPGKAEGRPPGETASFPAQSAR